jgi:peptide/nickel transport system ATP-binding protein
MDIQRQNKTTMLFISHDLSVVRYIADRVVVMYLGHIVEQGTTDQIFSPPYHPYTEALLSAIPIADTAVVKKHIVLEGDIPSAMNPPSGCPFQTRCRYKGQVPGGLCETQVPPVRNLGNGHQVKCHLPESAFAAMEPVISFSANGRSKDEVEADGTPPGEGPGFVGDAPKRPHGKSANPEAGIAFEASDEAAAGARLRREEQREGLSETGQRDLGGEGRLQVGWGSQSEDLDAPSAFHPRPDPKRH